MPRLLGVVVGLWILDVFGRALFPQIWTVVDPLFLLLVWLGLELPNGRFLWLWGAGLGFLKDCVTGGLFGSWTCTFGLVGWILGRTRHIAEREDPLIQGIWAGILTAMNALFYGLLMTLADPTVGWNRGWWGVWLLSIIVSMGCATWSFPRFKGILKRR